MDVIEELKFLGKFTQKKFRGGGSVWGGGGGGGGGGVSGKRGGGGQGGCLVRAGGVRVDVNKELKFL